MRGEVAMNQTSTAMLDNHEHVQLSKRCRDGEEKVTRNDPLGVQAQKTRPAHIASRTTCRSFRQILIHCSRRDPNVELQQQFVGDALLAPRWILVRHPTNELLNLERNRRTTGSRLQPPKQLPTRTVPTNQGLGTHHGQGVPPVK